MDNDKDVPPYLREYQSTENPNSPCLKANALVNGERREQYGGISEGFTIVAQLWSVLLHTEVTVQDVCRCMIALKLSRDVLVEKEDNLVDICGYAELAQMMRDEHGGTSE